MRKKNKFEPVGERVSIFKLGRTWYYHYVDDTGKQIRRTLKTTNKRAAQGKAAEIETQLREGNGPVFTKIAPVQEVIKAYLDFLHTENRANKTLVKYRRVFKSVVELCDSNHISLISGVNLRFMDVYRKRRKDLGRAEKTIYNETVIIRQLIKFAVSRKFLREDIMKGCKFKKPKPTKQPCWTMAEVERIIANSDGIARICFEILAYTGMRVGELCHLEWGDIDFEKNILRIRSKEIFAFDKSGHRISIKWKSKNGEDRDVPISPKLREILKALSKESNWLVTRPAIDGKNPRQMSDRWLLSQIKRVTKKLGLDGHLHTFRHSFVSHALVEKKIPVDVVRKWVGHIDPKIIENYTHVADDSSQQYMKAMNDENINDNDDNGNNAA